MTTDWSPALNAESTAQNAFLELLHSDPTGAEAQFRKITRGSWARIIRMARKPSKQEFRQTAIICGIGLFVLGAIGFAILVLMDNFLPWLIHDVFGIGN